ncbi:MAG TPA: YsnF/AvaK domain-containing protein [Bryobacteraceae bacterium]|jgi:uncharacterized protein (TIGR02271 family)|nr:YsnF/AvaK domain-containing protein [Bryobacteraceae bacterium]
MTNNRSTLVAVFRDRADAESAANELKSNGFSSNDVYVGSYSSAGSTGTTREWNATHQHEGGIKGWFKSLFGEDDDSSDVATYENAANTGGVLLTVQTSDENLDRATAILQKYNPVDINENQTESRTATAGQVNAGSTRAAQTGGAKRAGSQNLPQSIPVVQEDLQVGKRPVARGGVRVYSRVIETPKEEKVNLREETVRVDRQPVNRPAQAGDLRTGREEVIEVQEFAEEAVVQKQARVVEEVRVSKDVAERTETVRDTVRRQEVQVEDLGEGKHTSAAASATGRVPNEGRGPGTTATGDYREDFRRDFQTRYAASGGRYEEYEPAYQYGYTAANDPRYQGRSWDEVESDLRSDYGRRYPNSTWEKIKDSIRYGWDKVTGRTRSATAHGD